MSDSPLLFFLKMVNSKIHKDFPTAGLLNEAHCANATESNFKQRCGNQLLRRQLIEKKLEFIGKKNPFEEHYDKGHI